MKKIYLIFTVAFFCLAFKGESLHPIHISIAEIDCFTNKKEIQVALKIFTDDLETSIAVNNTLKLNLDSSKEVDDSDKFIERYLKASFKLSSDAENNIGDLKYLGKEYEDAATWIYFSYRFNTDIQKMKIFNKVVFNVYDDQKNLINLRVDRKLIKTVYTNKKSKRIEIDLK